MFRGNVFVVAALVALTGLAAVSQGAYFFEIWGVSADGSMDMYSPGGGYANGGSAGQFMLSKGRYRVGYMAFNGPSDGPDRKAPGQPGDTGDGVSLADWLVGKKAFGAALYFRNATSQTCDPVAAQGAYLNDPVTILGFRCANEGEFIDQDHVRAGSSASYDNPSVGPGDVAPPAWRMGQYLPAVFPPGYGQQGGVGGFAEPWRVSVLDSRWPMVDVTVDNLPGSNFRTPGFEGYSAYCNRFAFGWMVDNSDAHLVNGSPLTEADCTGTVGELEPRDLGGDGNIAEGWFAKHIDRYIVQAMAMPDFSTGVVECKGLVFRSDTGSSSGNSSVFSREGAGGVYAPYLAITATYDGDCDNDGCVDVVDLLILVQYFQIWIPEEFPPYDPECDFNCDGQIDVADLLCLVENFGRACLNE